MKYPKIGLSENGQVIECPVCKNEEIVANGEYCIICSAPTKNTCLGRWAEDHMNPPYREGPCKESRKQVLPGNARYCPYCGAETSFYEAKILKDWREEPEETQPTESQDQPLEELFADFDDNDPF